MNYICNCGIASKIRWGDFKRGQRCKCGIKKQRRMGKNHYNWNPNREEIAFNLNIRNRCRGLRSLNGFNLRKNGKTKNILGYRFKKQINLTSKLE